MARIYGTVTCSECDLSNTDTELRFTKSGNSVEEDVKDGKYSTDLPRGEYSVTLDCPGNGWVGVTPGSIRVGTRPKKIDFTSNCGN